MLLLVIKLIGYTIMTIPAKLTKKVVYTGVS